MKVGDWFGDGYWAPVYLRATCRVRLLDLHSICSDLGPEFWGNMEANVDMSGGRYPKECRMGRRGHYRRLFLTTHRK